jgi:hypothetical protein
MIRNGRTWIGVFCLALVLGFGVFAGAQTQAADPDFLIVAGGPTGGLFNIVGAAAAEILRKEFPKSVIDVVPGGSGPNLVQAEQKKITIGLTYANNSFDAWNGRDPAKPERPIRNVRGTIALFPSAIQIWVPANSPIKSFKDLAGKKICPSSPGQAPWQAFFNLLDIYGMTKADIEKGGGKIVQLTWSEATNSLANGQIDSVMWLTLFPHSSMVEVEVSRPVRLLSLEQDKMEAFLKKYGGGFTPISIPAGSYKGQKEPAQTLSTVGFFVTPTSAPDDVIYRIVKALWTNMDRLQKSHVSLAYAAKETVGRGMALPLHPGAEKFFRENSIPFDAGTLK